MKCRCCNIKEADKKNTHYLTDSIIRTCLNQEGSNERETGLYFDLSNNKAFIDVNYQRNTNIEKVEDVLGRAPNDIENKKARKIPFSVDYVFCSKCEKEFTKIENNFTSIYLDKFRNNEYKDRDSIYFDDYKTIKLFFLLQVWRSAIVEQDIFKIPNEIIEDLRSIIYNHKTITAQELDKFPLSVKYLTTIDEGFGMTGNYVGYTSDEEPFVIIMNDFVIQFFTSKENYKFFDFHNLNNIDNHEDFKNIESNKFIFKILDNESRRLFLNTFLLEDKIKPMKEFYIDCFNKLHCKTFSCLPKPQIVEEYLKYITKNNGSNLLHFSHENILKLTTEFLEKTYNIKFS